MSENVLEVLVYLFDNYLSAEIGFVADESTIAGELEQAGFGITEIQNAFDWLGDIADIESLRHQVSYPKLISTRVYTNQEMFKLSACSRGFLLQLEQLGLLDPITREIIIDKAMSIEAESLSLEEFKRIIGLVMLNSPIHEDILVLVEDLVYDEMGGMVH